MFIFYLILRLLLLPFAFLPYRVIHFLGKPLGTLTYYVVPKYRKRALSNLALSDLPLSNKEIRSLALESIQNLVITCLEYPKLSHEKQISRIATCENAHVGDALMTQGKGVIFFCGHQANWELLFLEGTSRMPGIAIGRPIKNRYLYRWVQKMREKFGGKIVTPKNALKEGLRGLKKGAFLGIVGDQGMPDSGFSSSFLGRKAYTSPAPALLAYKANVPLIVSTIWREKGKYKIHYSEPLFPNVENPMQEEVERLMHSALSLFEESVRKYPGQWLWIHNRWKQQTLHTLKRPYRQDSVALFLPGKEDLLQELPKIRSLYPSEHVTLFVPTSFKNKISLDAEVHLYNNLKQTLQEDFRFKLIFNFTGDPSIGRHYKKWAAQKIVDLENFEELKKVVKNRPLA